MTEKSRYWSPSRTYEFIFKIGKVDLTPDLIALNVITSIDLPYQTFVLQFFVDSSEIILQEIYGQKPIELTANLLGTSQFPEESIKFELMYLNSPDLQMNIQVQNPQTVQKDRNMVTLTAVPRAAYKTMNTFVNDIYQGDNIQNAITSLVGKTGASVSYDTNKRNTETIDQMLIPPSTLYNNLKYINRTWGIHNGLTAIYCSYDNVVHIKNLTSKMNQAQAFTLYQLALDVDNTKTIDKCNDGKHFYTVEDLKTSYEGNSAFALLAPSLVYVVKPRDRLAQNIGVNLETFSQENGLISKNTEIFFDKSAINTSTRISVHKDHTGYDLSQSFINANLSKKISNITDMSASVERSIKLLNLMNVGESVQVTAKTNDTDKLGGRYILKSSELKFQKAKDWESSAVVYMIRTNRTIT